MEPETQHEQEEAPVEEVKSRLSSNTAESLSNDEAQNGVDEESKQPAYAEVADEPKQKAPEKQKETEELLSFRQASSAFGSRAGNSSANEQASAASPSGKDWMGWTRNQAVRKLEAPEVKTKCRANFRLGLLCAKSQNYADALDHFHKC